MLVLSRFVDEQIVIGDDIVITVLEFRREPQGLKVRLGVAAPHAVAIHRREVYERIHTPAPAALESSSDGRP
jgi:carbon storage regulator